MRYAIVIENAGSNYSAHVPDLPGCVATGATVEETERSIREAIELHVEGMREDGTPIPPLSTIAGAGRDTFLVTRRERWKTVCARSASLALVHGRSTTPLGVTFRNRRVMTMSRAYLITNAILWAAAIVASALVGAPTVLSLIVLPSLAIVSLLLAWRTPRAGRRNI